MVKRVTASLVVFLFVLSVRGDGKEAVWEGYLFQDENGDIRIGWPVMAMVSMRPPHVLGDDLAARLKPHVSEVNDDYFHWSTAWFGTADDPKEEPSTGPPKVPLVLVKLRGDIEESDLRAEKVGHTGYQSRMQRKRLVMTEGKVETLEFLSQEWLLKWRDLRRLGPGPYWVHDPSIDASQAVSIATKAIPLLKDMQEISAISHENREKVAKVDRDARPVKKFQLQEEQLVLHWLVDVNEKYEVGIEGLNELGDLAPTSAEIREWFLDAADKNSFLNVVRQHWKADLGSFDLYYYHADQPGSPYRRGTLTNAALDDVLTRWSKEEFLNHQVYTKKNLEIKPPGERPGPKAAGTGPRPY
jgi:hypothetical protein